MQVLHSVTKSNVSHDFIHHILKAAIVLALNSNNENLMLGRFPHNTSGAEQRAIYGRTASESRGRKT